MRISVLGGGAWGTALASMLADNGKGGVLWARNAKTVASINSSQTNPAYLKDIKLSENLIATDDLAEACSSDVVLAVTPAQSFASLVVEIKPLLKDSAQLVLCAKGIDRTSGELLHVVAERVLGFDRVCALSGPSFAHDVARGLPTAVVLAASDMSIAQAFSAKLSAPRFRVYASDDLTGVEAGGALKNVLALAVGIARGLQLGASAEAALIARGFAELNRIAVALGAQPKTLAGLSGLGDLVLTCSSPQSRNFSYGMAIAQGNDLTSLPLAEGVKTAAVALSLAEKNSVEAPVIEAVERVLQNKLTAQQAVDELLSRPLRNEG